MPFRQDARRLRDLLRRRLTQLETRLKNAAADETITPIDLEREAKAIIALVKALHSTAEMGRAQEEMEDASQHDEERADAAIRRRLAQQLEVLCARTRPPRRGGGA